MSLQKNDIIELNITGMTSEGSGVGRHNGQAVFVVNSAIGDVLTVRIIKPSKTYAIGRIEKIITPSKSRVEPDCSSFYQCGGCTYRHISYKAELEVKQERVQDAVQRIGGFDNFAVDEIIGSAERNHYRNKAQIPIGTDKDGKLVLGFYAYHSHRIVQCSSCLLQPPAFNAAADIFKQWAENNKLTVYNEQTHKGLLRHLYLRYAMSTKQLMVCVVINGRKLPNAEGLAELLSKELPDFKSLIINENKENTNVILGKYCHTVFGSGYITDELCGLKFHISPLSFYQVNKDQAQVLYSKAKEYADLKPNDILLDLYCGTGTIGLSMASSVKQLFGVEIIPQAIENAKANARLNNITNAEFICADAAKAARNLKERGVNPTVVIVDPPRKGCDSQLIDTIVQMNPEKVVYVSCDPATLSRDLKQFAEQGYKPRRITPTDMFPCTAHVETVVLMSRVEGK